MILDVIAHLVVEVVGTAVSQVVGGALGELLPRRKRAAGRPWQKPVIVGAGAMADRAALYGVWAAAHGLAVSDKRGAEYAGSHRAREMELNTGLLGVSLPRSPEILVRVALDGITTTTLLEPGARPTLRALQAMATVLEVEGVRDVAVTTTFVRLRFDAFVKTDVFDAGVEAFERALQSLAAPSATPYR